MKKLSGKDVMPGDFVQRPGYGIGYVVECSIIHLMVNFNGKVEQLEWCNSVPLLNVDDGLLEHIRNRFRIIKPNFQYKKQVYDKKVHWYSFIINSRDDSLSIVGVFSHVHELQHALSAAGYSPLIDTETYSYVDK